MSETTFTSSGIVTYSENEGVTSYSSPELSNLFAGFLLGYLPKDTTQQKYIELYSCSSQDLYEYVSGNTTTAPKKIHAVPVRSASMTMTDGTYYARFVATFDGSVHSYESSTNSCIALRSGNSKILAVATFDDSIYDELRNGSRVDVVWKLGLD